MATDSNVTLVGNNVATISLGSSTGIIVQNLSSNKVRFKVSGSSTEVGGIFEPFEKLEFNYDIDVWADDVYFQNDIKLYVLKS